MSEQEIRPGSYNETFPFIMIGQTISRFTVQELLGEGPHGASYLGRDSENLHHVVIKILKPNDDPERRRLMMEDLDTVKALNQINIAQVLEVGEIDGTPYIVREYVSGESMEAALRRKRLRRKYALAYAVEIAEALQAAHFAGIVHGHVRPSNVILISKTRCKITDFGLRRLNEGAAFDTGTLPPEWTPEKICCFSPEQIRGAPLDQRSDIFSFAAMLYEMSTGRAAFRQEFGVATVQAILETAPKPISEVTQRPPRGLEKFFDKALQKDPEKRPSQLYDFITPFRRLRDDYEAGTEVRGTFFSEGWEKVMVALFGVLSVVVLAGGAWIWWSNRAPDTTVNSSVSQLTKATGLDTEPAISRRGDIVVFASDRESDGNLDLWIQPASGGRPRRLTQHTSDDHEPDIAPDGKTVAFRSERDGGGIYTVPTSGGEPKLIARSGRRPRYSPDGRSIAYWIGPPGVSPLNEGSSQVYLVDTMGGPARRIQEQFAVAAYPVWAPDGQSLLFLGRLDPDQSRGEAPDWWVAPLRPGSAAATGACPALRRQQLLEEGNCVVPADWLDDFAYFSTTVGEGQSLFRLKLLTIDPRPREPAVRVTQGQGLQLQPMAAENGRFVFSVQNLNGDIWSIPANANEAKITGDPIRLTQDKALDLFPTLSADGTKLLFQSSRSGNFTPWLRDLATGQERAVTNARQDQLWPRISPDGARLVFTETRIGKYEHYVAPLGVGTTDVLCNDCGPVVTDWTLDSRQVLINAVSVAHPTMSVALLRPGTSERTEILTHLSHSLNQARLSPDQHAVLFVEQGDAGNTRIWLAPFRGAQAIPESSWIALTDGSAWDTAPQFSPDQRLVYFTSNRDGSRCVWARRVDAAGRPEGDPFGVYHFHGARRSPGLVPVNGLDLFVAADRILISLGDLSGSVWLGKIGR